MVLEKPRKHSRSNGSGQLNNMAAGGGSFPYLAIEKPCKHSRIHNFCPIIMKVGQNIGFIDISDEFENGPDRLKKHCRQWAGHFSLYVYSKSM